MPEMPKPCSVAMQMSVAILRWTKQLPACPAVRAGVAQAAGDVVWFPWQ